MPSLINQRKLKRDLYAARRNVVRGIANAAPGFWVSRLQNPIFLIGMARSGTTILETLIAHHRDVADWSEANLIWDPSAWEWAKSSRETPPMWVDPEAYRARWLRDARGREQEIVAAFGLFQTVKGRRFFLNKAPANVWRIPFLLEHFPNAKLIHLIRDGRAVVNSHFVRLWPGMESNPDYHRRMGILFSYEELAERLGAFWLANMREVAHQNATLNLVERGIMLEVRYEQLAADPRGTLERISEHTGLVVDRFRPSVYDIRIDNRNYKWKEHMRPEAIERMTAAMEPLLSQVGYLDSVPEAVMN